MGRSRFLHLTSGGAPILYLAARPESNSGDHESMSQYLKSIGRDLLARGGAYPTPVTEKRALQSLLQRLHPVATDRRLVRLGPPGDGGYLIPDDLDGIEACFSPGVSQISGFEKDCAERGMEVFMADRSVDRPTEWHDRFHFTKKFVGVTTNDDFMTLDNWVKESLPASASDLLLQIDIEDCEYETFLGMSDALMGRFRIIVGEFHSLNHFWSRPFFQVASRAFDKILQTHSCVHIHPNNQSPAMEKEGLSIPPMMEFTFLRNDRIASRTPATVFPHPLDSENTAGTPLPLPGCWYTNG